MKIKTLKASVKLVITHARTAMAQEQSNALSAA